MSAAGPTLGSWGRYEELPHTLVVGAHSRLPGVLATPRSPVPRLPSCSRDTSLCLL